MRLPVLLLYLLTFSAAATAADMETWTYEGLRDDTRLTELFETPVQSINDRRIGSLRDILIGYDGKIEVAVVEFSYGDNAGGFALAQLDWLDTRLASDDQAMTVKLEASGGGTAPPLVREGIPGRKLIGQSVHIQSRRDFAKIDDLLLGNDTRQPSALLIDAGDVRYALPLPENLRDVERDGVNYGDVSLDDLQALGYFEEGPGREQASDQDE